MEIWVKDNLDRASAKEVYPRLRQQIVKSPDKRVELILSDDVHMDSVGAALLALLRREAREAGKELTLVGVGERIGGLLSVYRGPDESVIEPPPAVGYFEKAGERVSSAAGQALAFLVLASDTFALGVTSFFRRPVSWRSFIEQCVRIGSQSLFIVGLISFLVGFTTALQAAYQLKQFGGNIFIADLVGVAMLAEMGPLMTAILMAGRSGSSIAAEIATMVITEEVDALRTMGINPIRYVLLPRIFALLVTQPLLTVCSIVVGIMGGTIVAMTYLDLSFMAFWNQLIAALEIRDLAISMLKSVTFAAIIGLVAAHVGFAARGGATGVGRSTTASVVASIFLVIVADAVYSVIFYFGV